jgi:hypothetical protein
MNPKEVTGAGVWNDAQGKEAQMNNARDKAREDALEEAAQVCHEYAKSGVTDLMICAEVIRAMKEKK